MLMAGEEKGERRQRGKARLGLGVAPRQPWHLLLSVQNMERNLSNSSSGGENTGSPCGCGELGNTIQNAVKVFPVDKPFLAAYPVHSY